MFDISLAELRARRSAKWTSFPEHVLPLPVAEMDVRLAPPIAHELHRAIADSDTGYAGDIGGLTSAFTHFAHERWGWQVADATFRTCADVATGATELLRLLAPGGQVVVTPPVYPPFYSWIAAAGARPLEVPLQRTEGRFSLDLTRIEEAFRGGARVLLLCHPHNPTGHVVPREDLSRLADLAAEHGAIVVSDEIHAPLVMPGTDFTPFLAVNENAARTGIALHSASKAWNLAGLKCALIVTTAAGLMPTPLPHELSWGVGHLGLRAAEVAYRDGEPWLDDLLLSLTRNSNQLRTLISASLPAVSFYPPEASYLAWIDFTKCGLPGSPARFLRDAADVALGDGADFGTGGVGYVRLNFACSPAVLSAAITRIAAAAHDDWRLR